MNEQQTYVSTNDLLKHFFVKVTEEDCESIGVEYYEQLKPSETSFICGFDEIYKFVLHFQGNNKQLH